MSTGLLSKKVVISFAVMLLLASMTACATTSTGDVKDDTTLTGKTRRLTEAGEKYTGPEYLVGIITFANQTPSKVQDIGEAATTILRTLLVQAGLKPILLDERKLSGRKEMTELQESGEVKTGKKRTDAGFDTVDYRFSGAITAYSEVGEGVNATTLQSKSRVARVTVDYALLDIATGKSLVAGSDTGEYRKTMTNSPGLGPKSSSDTNLRDGALRDALAKALNKMIARLSSQPFRGTILLADGESIVVRAGTRSHLSEGTELIVYRPGREIHDPDTGKLLGRKESKIGVIKITHHEDERLSEASVVSGTGFRSGDVVKVGL